MTSDHASLSPVAERHAKLVSMTERRTREMRNLFSINAETLCMWKAGEEGIPPYAVQRLQLMEEYLEKEAQHGAGTKAFQDSLGADWGARVAQSQIKPPKEQKRYVEMKKANIFLQLAGHAEDLEGTDAHQHTVAMEKIIALAPQFKTLAMQPGQKGVLTPFADALSRAARRINADTPHVVQHSIVAVALDLLPDVVKEAPTLAARLANRLGTMLPKRPHSFVTRELAISKGITPNQLTTYVFNKSAKNAPLSEADAAPAQTVALIVYQGRDHEVIHSSSSMQADCEFLESARADMARAPVFSKAMNGQSKPTKW